MGAMREEAQNGARVQTRDRSLLRAILIRTDNSVGQIYRKRKKK